MSQPGYNLIGDVHGNYSTLRALLEKMPKEAIPVSCGDMVDRGPSSHEVVAFFRNEGLAVLGNHEHMMLDALAHPDLEESKPFYQFGLWENQNGGLPTCEGYTRTRLLGRRVSEIRHALIEAVPAKEVEWLAHLPFKLDLEGGLIVTHAPKNPTLSWTRVIDCGADYHSITLDGTLIWNRGTPRAIPGHFQVYGHLAQKSVIAHENGEGLWGMCIDTYRGKKLTGMHWPSKELFEQEIIDK